MNRSTGPVDPTRRQAVRILAALPAALGLTPPLLERAWRAVRASREPAPAARYAPRFFTPHEWRTVRLLADYVIPRDERSGSGTDAQVPEFMDFVLAENAGLQTQVRGGLAWLDTECRERFARDFADAADAERRAVLDDIAWPARARPEYSHGVAFFNVFRDLTASGFFSSKMGMEDLQYLGNTVVAEWTGCPPAALARLGVEYE